MKTQAHTHTIKLTTDDLSYLRELVCQEKYKYEAQLCDPDVPAELDGMAVKRINVLKALAKKLEVNE